MKGLAARSKEGYLAAMPTSLRQQLDQLAASFAAGLLAAIRAASIEDLLAESGGSRRLPAAAGASESGGRARKAGRLARRSASDIESVVSRIEALLRSAPRGLRAEEIRRKLDLQPREMPRPLGEAIASGRLGKSGQRRATTYFVKSGASAARPAGKAPAGKARKARAASRKK